MATMNKEAINSSIREHDGYLQPLLNDQLYLHCKGFMKIDPIIGIYKNVKALWLQQNALSAIESLDDLELLGCLYLHQNCITKIANLPLANLHTLNLSQNYITKIENLEACPLLETLLLANNRISDIKSLEGVKVCTKLSCLDLSHNAMKADTDAGETPEDVITILQDLPELACLYLQANELPNQTRYFRRKMVGTIKTLTYMDDRPVFPEDRRAIDAWMVGGFEGEQAERDAIREEKKAAEKASLVKYKALQEQGRALKEQREKELHAYEAAKQEWHESNKPAFEKQRRDLINESEDVATVLWKDETSSRQDLHSLSEDDLPKVHAAQASREAIEAEERTALLLKEEARLEIEREEREAEVRREAYLAELKQVDLTRQQEITLLREERKIIDDLEQGTIDTHLAEIEALMKRPAEKKKKEETRHIDPLAAGSKKAAIFAKYAAWEARGARKSH